MFLSCFSIRGGARRCLTGNQRLWVRKQLRKAEAPMVALRAARARDLDSLARYYGTDKSSIGHGYARLYERHLKSRRLSVRSVLEIGVGGSTSGEGYETAAGGRSLRMWRDYFPRAQIIGVDLHWKAVAGGRITFEQGDQSDAAFLAVLAERYGPFDLVIDDGSHIGTHINASFKALWGAVRSGGLYVIEDLAVAYHPGWGGGPPGTPGTSVELIKESVDDTIARYEEANAPSISAMHLYSGIVFLEKR